jgi:hydroxymethylpyrimidine pyrophosphatase-like HAD family hydrolase
MESNTYFFTDLDDTLVQSKHKMDSDVYAQEIASNADGKYIGFATSYQLNLLDRMGNNALVIPVTGRNKNALNRCDWKWDSYQVVSHGAVILNKDGSLNNEWLESIKDEMSQAKSILSDFMISAEDILSSKDAKSYLNDNSVDLRIITDQGIPAYMCGKQLNLVNGKNNTDAITYLAINLQAILEKKMDDAELPYGWRMHVNGRNFAILPPYASKAKAVDFVKKLLNVTPNDLTIGLGDSMSDLAFMNECQLWVTPSKGQINQFLQTKEHTGI